MSDSQRDETHNVRQVPTFGRGTRLYRGVVSDDFVTGEDHTYSVWAYHSDDGFEVSSHDGGHWPVDERHTAVWVEQEHIPDLILTLGGKSGDDPVELLAQKVQDGAVKPFGILNWFSEHGVPHTFDSKNISNL